MGLTIANLPVDPPVVLAPMAGVTNIAFRRLCRQFGDDGVLYGVAGTRIFSVNTSTGAAANPINYAGQGLVGAFGQSFFTEAGAPPIDEVPEPSTYALMTGGLGLLLILRKRA